MTLTLIRNPALLMPIGLHPATIGANANQQFNAAGDKLAIIFHCPSTDVPDQITFEVAAVTTAGTAGNIEATLETVAADGTPSGTPVTNSATGSAAISTTGVKTIPGMDGTATVAEGDLVALVLTAGAGWDRDLTIKYRGGAVGAGLSIPYYATKDTAGSWVKASAHNVGLPFGVAKADGTYLHIPGLHGCFTTNITQTAYADASNPDEMGNQFIPDVPCALVGALAFLALGTNRDYSLSLYSSHLATPSQLATRAFDGDHDGGTNLLRYLRFAAPVNLTAGTTYAITVKARGTSNITLHQWDFTSNAELDGFVTKDFFWTQRDGGAGAPANPGNNFANTNTRVAGVFPILKKFDDGAAAGGGLVRHGGMSGGLTG